MTGLLFEVGAFVVGFHCTLCFLITARDLLDISVGSFIWIIHLADPQMMLPSSLFWAALFCGTQHSYLLEDRKCILI